MTHCSACGRRLRFKPAVYGGGAPADWLNHARTCPRYGQAPDHNPDRSPVTGPVTFQTKDIIRARRYGNRTVRTYVIDKQVEMFNAGDRVAAIAHPQYGGDGRFMVFDAATVRVVGNYRP